MERDPRGVRKQGCPSLQQGPKPPATTVPAPGGLHLTKSRRLGVRGRGEPGRGVAWGDEGLGGVGPLRVFCAQEKTPPGLDKTSVSSSVRTPFSGIILCGWKEWHR